MILKTFRRLWFLLYSTSPINKMMTLVGKLTFCRTVSGKFRLEKRVRVHIGTPHLICGYVCMLPKTSLNIPHTFLRQTDQILVSVPNHFFQCTSNM